MLDIHGDARILQPVLFFFKRAFLYFLRIRVIKDVIDKLEPCIGYAFGMQTEWEHRLSPVPGYGHV
jgi:hypothetical protein